QRASAECRASPPAAKDGRSSNRRPRGAGSRHHGRDLTRRSSGGSHGGAGMDEATFWSLIDRFDWSKEEDDDIIEPAVLALALLPDSQILDFQQILARKLYALD